MDLALFDFDGTLTERETFPLFVRTVTPPARVAAGSVVLLPIVAGYRLGWISGSFTRAAIVRLALSGLSAAAVAAAGEQFAQATLPQLLRPQAWARLQWHRARGDTVAIVIGRVRRLSRALVPRTRSGPVLLRAAAARRTADRPL